MAKAKTKETQRYSRSSESYREFVKTFEQLAYTRSYGEVFEDFLDFSLFMLSFDPDETQKETMLRMDKKYKASEGTLMGKLFDYFTHAAENDETASDGDGLNPKGIVGFHDVLGDLFMDLVSHGNNGQFFTPQHVCDMMALMVVGDPKDAGTDPYSHTGKEPMSVCDPACGSGRMLMAAAKIDRHMTFYGADVSATCAKMTALNMTINTMQGEVACMNSLSMEHYHSWHIRRMRMGTHYLPLLFRTGKNQTRMIGFSKPENIEEIAPIEKVRQKVAHLFNQIPEKDTRESLIAKAAMSKDAAEKYTLWTELAKVVESQEKPAEVVPITLPPPQKPPAKKKAVVRKLPVDKPLSQTGTLFD